MSMEIPHPKFILMQELQMTCHDVGGDGQDVTEMYE